MSELPEHPATLAPPTIFSPAKRIETFTDDPNFMTSLAHGLVVIRALQERKRHLTIAQINHRTEILRAAVCRCLHTLMQLGYATTDRRTCSLLPKMLTLGHVYLSSTPLAIIAQPTLGRLSEQLHEACPMTTLEDDDILYITRLVIPQRLIPVDLNVNSRLPAYCTSMGRILLVTLDDDALHAYFGGVETQAKTNRTLYIPETLLPCLVEIRCQGWCIVDQELEVDLCSLAVPVRDSVGHVLTALNVGTHAGWVSRAELEGHFLPLLLEANRELSARLFT